MKKITILLTFLITAMSYGQVSIADGDFTNSSLGILSKNASATEWFGATNRTTTPDCNGTTIPAREDTQIEVESGNNVAVFYDNNKNCKSTTNTVVDFPALLNTKILNLAVNTAYIVQFDIKRVGNDGAGKPFDVQIRTTPSGAGTRLPWFVNVVNGDPLYDRVPQGDITTTFSTKKARFTTPGTIDTNETYYLTLVKNQAAWGSTTDKYVVDNVSISAEVTWTGASSADWSTAGNWDTGALPTEFDYVTIPTGTGNNPIISATTAAVANNITTNDVLTIASGGSLIVGGTSTGNVTYTEI